MNLEGPVWYPYTQMQTANEPIKITRGEGIYLFDSHGNKYVDGISSWWVNIHGHSHPHIAKAIADQALQLEHVIFAGFTHDPALNLAKKILSKCKMPDGKVFFSDNGSTAVEVAAKMSLQYFFNIGKPRTKIVSFENGFHGETFGAMSMGDQDQFNKPFKPLMFKSVKIPIPQSINDDAKFKKIESIFAKEDVAAFIFEPLVQGTGGMVFYKSEILDKLITLARKYQTLIIADEVMTGFYRTGTFLAIHQLSTLPDLICLAKGLTGGFLPLALTVSQNQIFESFLSDQKSTAFFHGHSYTANPLGCAAALASIDLTESDEFGPGLAAIMTYLIGKTIDLSVKFPNHQIRCNGTIFALNIPSDQQGYFSNLQIDVHRYFLDKGIFLRPLGNVLYLMPQLCIKVNELEYLFREIEIFLKEY